MGVVLFMSKGVKYSKWFKDKAIYLYKNQGMSAAGIAADIGVGKTTVVTWIRQFEKDGLERFEETTRNKAYTKEFKLAAVQSYLQGEGSMMDICLERGISCDAILCGWIKKYNGHEAILDYDPKGDVYMTKGRATTLEERLEIVQWCLSHERQYKLAAERYKVSYIQVYTWVAKYLQTGEAGLTDRRGKKKAAVELTAEETQALELKRLQDENERLRMEIEVLKKVKEVERRLYSEHFGKKRNTSR
jgi:transposase-like protein